MIRKLSYSRILLALRGALGLSLLWLLLLGDWRAVVVVGTFLVLSFAYLLRSEPRPNAFDVLFALAALGYVFNLFSEIVPYDELTHAFTTFAVSLAFYFLFYGGLSLGKASSRLAPRYLRWALRWGPTGRYLSGSRVRGSASRTRFQICSWTV